MAKFLIFKVSANGQPKKWNLPAMDTFNWPRLTHICWETYDENQTLLSKVDKIIKPRGFAIPANFEDRTGITTEMANEEGHDLLETLNEFSTVIKDSEIVVAHNLNFNENVVGAECVRLTIPNTMVAAEKYCLMHESTYFCRLKGQRGKFKWPSLGELFQVLFKAKYEGPGNAANDLLATSASFFRLVNLGELDDIFE